MRETPFNVVRREDLDPICPHCNEQLAEVRYVWVARDNLTLDFRVRLRKEIDQLVTAERKREELDVFARLTWRRAKERNAFIN